MSDQEWTPLVSYVLVTYNRADDLEDAIDSILAQNYRPFEIIVISSSTDNTSELFRSGGKFDSEAIQYHHLPDRMGPAKARNVGYERASGDILVTIDDDAVMTDADATDEIISLFRDHEDVGVLAFQSRDYRTKELIRMEIPDPPDFETPPSERYRTTAFIGVGNAIRASTLEAAGGYPEDFEYGFEEMDLSIRVLDAGYDILYAPSVVVYHKKSQAGRRPALEERELQIENRIRLAIRNLPWRYVVGTTLLWSSYWFLRSGFRISSLARIFRRLYQERDGLLSNRTVIDAATIKLVKERSSMLFLWWFGPDPRRIVGPGGDLDRLSW